MPDNLQKLQGKPVFPLP